MRSLSDEANPNPFPLSAFYNICLPLVLFFNLCLVPLISEAQTGVITGRVVTEDGRGLPGVTVSLMPLATDRRERRFDSENRIGTDLDGNFKFTGLASRVYSISTSDTKGYVSRPVPVGERQDGGYHRVGDNVTITLMKGGVITGRVTNATGEPLIGVKVNAVMVRDGEGKPARDAGSRSRITDDRGLYRIYGLPPGTYVVLTNNAFSRIPSPYDGDRPIYHPSSTRETAAEVTVVSGGEAGGVDIQYRGDRGYIISGSINGSGEPSSSFAWNTITLTNSATGADRSDAIITTKGDGVYLFAIYGVTDGEYEISARWVLDAGDEVKTSSPRRVVVKGADVGGLELKLLPLGTISGKFTLEASPVACNNKHKWSLGEALIALHHETKPGAATPARNQTIVYGLTEKGEFTVNNLPANRYILEPRMPDENWYVKAISASAGTLSSANGRRAVLPADNARIGIALKAGEKLAGVTVTIAEGAAGVSGKVIPATGRSQLPARLRVHLVPAEAGAADHVLRYAETNTRGNGAFLLNNISPGKYWLFARAAPDDEDLNRSVAPIAWDASNRMMLRKEAEAMKLEVELKPCQRVSDQVVKY